MIKTIGIAFVSLIIIILFKDKGNIYTSFTRFYGLLLVISLLIPKLADIFNKVNSSFFTGILGSDITGTVIKLCGIAFVSSVCADICRDESQNSFAYIIECAGNIAMLVTVFPLMTDVLDKICEIMK